MNKELETERRKAVQNYMDYLAGAQTKFETALNALKDRTLTPDVRKSAKDMAHKIAGNALMYGYESLGDKARDLESFFLQDDPIDQAQGQSLCLKVINKIEDIRSVSKTPNSTEFESDDFHQDPTPNRWSLGSIETEGSAPVGHRPSVLIVHSDPWIMDLMANMLEPDHIVQKCEMAHEAMAMAANAAPDLIITEQNLPDMSGIDLTKFVRNVESLHQVPVIMIMGADDPESIVEAVQAGATDCFENGLEVLPIINHAKELMKKTQYQVLIVDDDMAVRELLRQRFETYGVRVDTTSDGIEALEYLRSKQPDLIILDRMMPRLEGGAVLYQIQQEVNLKSIPVMLVTAMTNRDDVLTWLKRGATDYITKPFNPDEVVLRALRHLRIEKDAA